MHTTLSADGTRIAYDRSGSGPPIIMVVGAFNDRSTTAPLAKALEPRLTVLNPDRRGRGDSGDTAPYSVEREIEDLDALIADAGGSASVFGYSSGAVLALQAAGRGLAIDKLVLYEPPFLVDETRPRPPADLAQQVAALVSAGRRGEAVELFQTQGVGMPEEVVVGLRDAPFRPGLEAIAHTLVYDATITGDLTLPAEMLAAVATPTLVIAAETARRSCRTGRAPSQTPSATAVCAPWRARRTTSTRRPPRPSWRRSSSDDPAPGRAPSSRRARLCAQSATPTRPTPSVPSDTTGARRPEVCTVAGLPDLATTQERCSDGRPRRSPHARPRGL